MKKILWLAPMDGFTNRNYRHIVQETRDQFWDNQKYDFLLWTEFMTADGFFRNPEWVIHHLESSPIQKKLIVQIFGGNPETLVYTAKKLQKDYKNRFIGIELNMWCPANNVMKSGWWAELIKDKKRSLEIIKELRKAINIPFSIKTRIGTDQNDKKNQTNFLIKASPFVDMITIHARSIMDKYWPNLDRDFIYQLKEKLPTQKIIWNWGINTYSEIEEKMWNLDWIMIWQAAIWNPRIFTPHQASNPEKLEKILKHLDLIKKSFSEENLNHALVEFRKHLYSYIKGIPNSKEFKIASIQCKNFLELTNLIKIFFSNI